MDFQLVSEYTPQGDQPTAIAQLTGGLNAGETDQVLLGVTGSGKTGAISDGVRGQDLSPRDGRT